MRIFIFSLFIIIVRIVASAFAGELSGHIRIIFRLTSYFGMALAAFFLSRVLFGMQEGFKVYDLLFILVSLLFSFALRKSILLGRALETAMSGLLVCFTTLAFITTFSFEENTGLCFVGCIAFYDLWFLSDISLEHEERYSYKNPELFLGALIVFLSSVLYGFLLFRATFYRRFSLSNFLSVAMGTILLIYCPAGATAAFVIGERNNRPLKDLWSEFVRRKRRDGDLHWDYEGEEQKYDWGRKEDGYESRYSYREKSRYSNTSKSYEGSFDDYHGYKEKHERSTSNGNYLNDELKRAMRIFGLDNISNIKKEELDIKRRRLMKKYHPDSGRKGNTLRAAEINAAYDLLKRYV